MHRLLTVVAAACACHEGNDAVRNMLRATRAEDTAAEKAVTS